MKINKKGFSLVELLVVVLIIAILSAIALPRYRIAVEKSRIVRMLPLLRAITSSQERAKLANGAPTLNLDELDVSLPYKTKEGSTVGGVQRVTYTLNGGMGALSLYEQNVPYVVWSANRGYTIDYYGIPQAHFDGALAICYPHNNKDFEDVGEKACAAIGHYIRTKGDGTKIFAVE